MKFKHRTSRVLFLICIIVIHLSYVQTESKTIDSTVITRDSHEEQDQPQLGSECIKKSTCEQRQTIRKRLDSSSSCNCDDKCEIYDDCCSDYKPSLANERKIERKHKCHRINDEFGDVQVVARCPVDWHSQAVDMTPQLINMIERLCRQSSGGNRTDEASLVEIQSDPMGAMMPITEALSNTTYANSYCLRCNLEDQRRQDRLKKSNPHRRTKFISWSPSLKCNYDKDNDDKSTLFDLISNSMGDALEFSVKLNRWTINRKLIKSHVTPEKPQSDLFGGETVTAVTRDPEDEPERTCSIVPTAPKQVSRILRPCNADSISSCDRSKDWGRQAQRDCEVGPRSLVFSKTRSDRVYRNFACALCNGETAESTNCRLPSRAIKREHLDTDGNRTIISTDLLVSGRAQVPGEEVRSSTSEPVAASFALIFDIYGNEGQGGTVGVVTCPGAQQVYDPFFMKCRCVICGLNKYYRDGRCVDGMPQARTQALSPVPPPKVPSPQRVIQEISMPPPSTPQEPRPQQDQPSQVPPKSQAPTSLSSTLNLDDLKAQEKHQADKAKADSEFEQLIKNHLSKNPLPETTKESQENFRSCGKIPVQAEHFRFFTMSDKLPADYFQKYPKKNHSSPTVVVVNQDELLAYDVNLAHMWAYVKPYELVIPSSQYELKAEEFGSTSTKRDADSQYVILICTIFNDRNMRKFSLEMGYVSAVCLGVSIVSLALYLFTHFLSMLDLSCLVHKMEVEDRRYSKSSCPIRKESMDMRSASQSSKAYRSRSHSEGNKSLTSIASSTANRNRSLSSRGVACLSASLLCAYLLFIFSYKPMGPSSEASKKASDWNCKMMAIATNYCFLVAFTWMFLMSYDIWRTLRLATNHLLAPTTRSQSKRFMSYVLFSLLMPALVVGFSILIEQAPLMCENQAYQPEEMRCSPVESGIDAFIKNYKPRYGRPGATGVCWFMSRNALALFFGLPISIIIAINLIWFLHCSWMVIQTTKKSSRMGGFKIQAWPESKKVVPVITRMDSLDSYQGNNKYVTKIEDKSSLPTSISNGSTVDSRRSVKTVQSSIGSSGGVISSACSTSDESSGGEESNQMEKCSACTTGVPINKSSSGGLPNETKSKRLAGRRETLSNLDTSIEMDEKAQSSQPATPKDQFKALMSKVIADYRLYCRLCVMMGLTWIVGVMASYVNKSPILWFLFIILNALQGFFIFVGFGLKNEKLRNIKILKDYFGSRIFKCTRIMVH